MSLNQILHLFVWNGLGLAILAAPMAIGAVHWPVWMGLAALSGALLTAYALLHFRRGYRLRFDGFVVVGLAMAAMMFLQLVPMGDGLLEKLSPGALSLLGKGRELGYEIPGRLSLAPAETVRMLVTAGMALAIYLVAFNLAYRDNLGPRILAIVGFAGALVALAVFLHKFTGTRQILGFYEPTVGIDRRTMFFSTFVNNNNAAAFLNLSLMILAGQWQKAQFGRNKGVYAVLVLLTGAASLSMMSRGGVAALMVAGAMLIVFSRWVGGPRRSTGFSLVALLGIAVTVVCMGIFIALFDLALNHTEGLQFLSLADEDAKTQVWRKALETVSLYKVAGAGAGAFGPAFAPFNSFAPGISFPSAENEAIEVLVEFGVPAGLLLALAITMLFWRRLPFARSDGYHTGAFAGLFAVALQSLADFPLRIPGVLIPAVAVLGALSGSYARDRDKVTSWPLRIGGLKLLPLATVGYLLILLGGAWVGENSPKRYQAALAANALPDRSLEEQAVSLHPSDPMIFELIGDRQDAVQDTARAESLYRRALDLCPQCVSARLRLAGLMLMTGRDRQGLEIMSDMAAALPNHRKVIFLAVAGIPVDESVVVEVFSKRPELLRLMAEYLAEVAPYDRSERLLREALEALGMERRLLTALGKVYVKAGHPEAADDVATYLMGYFPESFEGFLLQAQVDVLEGRVDDALLMYEEACEASLDNVELELEYMGVLARTRNWDRFEALSAEVRPLLGKEPKHRSRYHQLMALREEMRGNHFAALAELEQAEAHTPFNIRIPLDKAGLQIRLGRPDRAAAEYRKALKIDPQSKEASEGLKNLESTREAQALQ